MERKSKTNNDIINEPLCFSCKKYMCVKEKQERFTNIYGFCTLKKDINCSWVEECNQWTAIK